MTERQAWCPLSLQNASSSRTRELFSGLGKDAATAAALSQAEPLVVSGAFLTPQPCNFAVWGVIIPSLFIVIVFLAL